MNNALWIVAIAFLLVGTIVALWAPKGGQLGVALFLVGAIVLAKALTHGPILP